jgi:hypothetical protein
MRRGVVMEVNDPYVTLLTSNGEFLRARKMDRVYAIGEEIDFFPVTDHLPVKRKKLLSLKTVWLMMAVLTISLGSIIPVYQSNKAYAYMSIDASSSIEMGLNKDMQVVELKGFNKEADSMISQLDNWRKMDASELTSIIIAELKEDGLITLAKPVVISTVKTEELKESGAEKLQENIEQIKQKVNKNLIEVNMYTSTEAEVEKAKDKGVPIGVYHRNKNNSAQKKKTKEKIIQTENTPLESSSTTALPPGQQKKQEQESHNANNNQQVYQNQGENIQNDPGILTEQGNGKQIPPGLNKEANDLGIQNKENKNQEKPKTNNQNKSSKQVKNNKK